MLYAAQGLLIFLTISQLVEIADCQCPEFFRYFRNDTTGEIMGIVEIPHPPQGVSLHLQVILSVATVLPTKYVGRIELAKSKEESIRAILHGIPLYYRIYFPVRHPIPEVISIALNSFQYCTGPPAMGVIVTNIILEHILYPPRVIIPLTEQLLNFISNHSSPASTTSPTIDVTTERRRTTILSNEIETTAVPNDFSSIRPIKQQPVDSSCGIVGESSSLISSAESNSPVLWPWLAAIFVLKDELDFQCTGNLISRQHVLTTARCLREGQEQTVSADMMLVSLGRSDLWNWKEPGSVNAGVTKYVIHPNFKNLESADCDIAVVKLSKRTNITPNVRPICLWMDNIDLDDIIGKSGYAIGWGSKNQNKNLLSEPRKFKMPIVSQGECLRSNDKFFKIISSRTFCAGKRDGIDSCAVGEGSGLVMFHDGYQRYHIRGIVSSTLPNITANSCDSEDYIVYVDIAKYLPWIRREII